MNQKISETVYKRELRYILSDLINRYKVDEIEFRLVVGDHFIQRCVERNLRLNDASRMLTKMFEQAYCQLLFFSRSPDIKNLMVTDTVSYLAFKRPVESENGIRLHTFYRKADRANVPRDEMVITIKY